MSSWKKLVGIDQPSSVVTQDRKLVDVLGGYDRSAMADVLNSIYAMPAARKKSLAYAVVQALGEGELGQKWCSHKDQPRIDHELILSCSRVPQSVRSSSQKKRNEISPRRLVLRVLGAPTGNAL